jgi:hypothetical protein
VVALNLGTLIVLILAVLFFGGIIFLGTHSRTTSRVTAGEKSETPDPETSAMRVKAARLGVRPQEVSPKHSKGKHQPSRA